MKILYSLPHPADRLGTHQAGHVVRATALLAALKDIGNEIITLEAASVSNTKASVGIYRRLVKRILPRPIAMRIRDFARIRHGKEYARLLVEAIQKYQPDVILETHIAFSLAGKIASEQTGVPLVIDDCAPAWEEEQQYGVGLRKAALEIHREVTNQARLLIAVNKTLHQYLLDEGQPSEKVIAIENGFDTEYFHSGINGSAIRQQYELTDDSVVIVFVGSFQAYHRVDLLLHAFSQLYNEFQNAYLLLVGAGDKFEESKELATQLNLSDRIVFTGSVPYEKVASFLAAGNIAIMPATNDYGNPMKIYEYMALGKAVTAPSQPTITEIAEHGENSYLFEPEDIESMAATLKKLIGNPELCKELGDRGRQLACEHTWEKRALTLQDALVTIVNSK
jgi:glycosyltransferase involved in cell wall biosynthesis